MRETPSYAYSLSQADEGWRWSVYDVDGETIAGGAHLSREAAQAAIDVLLENPPRSFAA